MLRTEASFEIYNSDEGLPGEINNEDLIAKEVSRRNQKLVAGDSVGEFSFRPRVMSLIDENDGEGDDEQEEHEQEEQEEGFNDMGLGIDGDEEIEEYYKMKLKENPSNPLFLRKYAQLLQSKGDLSGAEEHYFLATLADPKDGDTLMRYAKLIWELYHHKDRAFCYFKRAVLAAPEDSHVLGAYARFIWEIDDEDLQGEEDEDYSGAASDGEIISEYAKFIWRLHHDKDKAAFYFERALQASPEDSNVAAAYASFLWQIEEDEDGDGA